MRTRVKNFELKYVFSFHNKGMQVEIVGSRPTMCICAKPIKYLLLNEVVFDEQ